MRTLLWSLCWLLVTSPLWAQSRSYRLPSVDLKQKVVWGSEAETSAGYRLAFGGLDQDASDGNPHTRVLRAGLLTNIATELKDKHPLASVSLRDLAARLDQLDRSYRHLYLSDAEDPAALAAQLKQVSDLRRDVTALSQSLTADKVKFATYEKAQIDYALKLLDSIDKLLPTDLTGLSPNVAASFGKARHLARQLEDSFSYEPPARALSPLVYDPHSKLFVVFGGDHLDYLSNDIWVFDPTTERWQQRHPAVSPAPRANHSWKVLSEGRLELRGGYTYTSTTDYMGGQYRELDDGVWIYDIAKNEWTGEQPLVATNTRVFRTGALHPDFYLARPNRSEFHKWLAELPANTWRATNPPHKPELNRDWGTAVIDPKTREILRFSGGHCAHGGTDVLHYSLATNRWLLTDPVEFPLGQLYTNTGYPHGVSFNKRAWITGHTYQSYACRPSGGMIFVGQTKQVFDYNSQQLKWEGIGRDKPPGMDYNDCFYTLTLTTLPEGIVCWTQQGRLFFLANDQWQEWKLSGDKLPGSSVDNSTLTYDSAREQLLFFRKEYGDDHPYDGIVHALDLKSKTVSKLTPEGASAAHQVSYLCQIRYDSASDLALVGCTLAPNTAGQRRTPAYDPKHNRWVTLKLTGDDPSGPKGRNVSLGLMYDAPTKLFWATDTKSQVFVLRLEPHTADLQPLR